MILDDYRFVAPLGHGSFGSVWRVEYLRDDAFRGRSFAAKISDRHVDSAEVRLEMQETSGILQESHDHILQLYLGEEFHGRLLILFELADSTLLHRWLRFQGSFAPPEIGQLLGHIRQAAVALDYLHDRGHIHGGVNPEDLLILHDEVKLSDPGPPIPMIQSSSLISISHLSKAFCMAPERRKGIAHFHSDQYALAATYCWLRAGQPVFGLTPLSDLHFLNGILSEQEITVLTTATSMNPDARYPDCVRFVDALASAQ